MSINRVNISGNLTRDSELRNTGSMDVLSFGVAVNDRRKNQQTGEWEDYPNFIECTVFGKRATSLHQYLKKGMKVAIEGKLRWSQWEKDGEKRSSIKVICDDIEFMSGNNQNAAKTQPNQQPNYQPQPNQYQSQPAVQNGFYEAPQQAYQSAPYQNTQQPQPAVVMDLYDEDIPF